jgi:hypothetical protein
MKSKLIILCIVLTSILYSCASDPVIAQSAHIQMIVPRNYVRVHYRSIQYYVRNNHWYTLEGTTLVEQPDPTK